LQFQFGKDEDGEHVVFIENGSKNCSGSYEEKADNKVIKQYAQPQLKEQCYVYILCFYLSKFPQIASKREVFYWQPKESMPMSPLGLIY